jgi:hypothetical protein
MAPATLAKRKKGRKARFHKAFIDDDIAALSLGGNEKHVPLFLLSVCAKNLPASRWTGAIRPCISIA